MKNSNVGDRQQCFSVEEAQQLSGLKKWQVSTWGTRLEEPEKYRAGLMKSNINADQHYCSVEEAVAIENQKTKRAERRI